MGPGVRGPPASEGTMRRERVGRHFLQIPRPTNVPDSVLNARVRLPPCEVQLPNAV
jgi:hypothetical protein